MLMRLTELEPHFVIYEDRIEPYSIIEGDESTWRERGCPTKEVTGPKQYVITIDTLDEAQGVWFLCPKCFITKKGKVRTHSCQVTFDGRRVAEHHGSHGSDNRPTRWQAFGTGFDNLSVSPSILLIGGCAWHGFITNGEIVNA